MFQATSKDALVKIKQALRENGKEIKDKLSRATPIATKGTKRSAATMSSRTKNASIVTKAIATKKETKRPSKATSTSLSNASDVLTEDDMMKLVSLILDME